ncbi:MAG: hypothetical protein ING90_20860 [Rhodocyclaceae bacterium]|jgi:hypothetical protein|nr:hypothetical protein [Rhodocyclaceae bacterium]
MAAALLVLGALVAMRWWLAYLDAREARRHSWRLELVQTKAAAWKAEALEELRQRLARLELRGTR